MPVSLDTEGARALAYRLQQNIRQAIVGKDQAIELMLIALICKGHILLEDVPGVGKTTLAAALARSVSCTFSRIQFTPDVTPSDVTGYTMLNMSSGQMEFKSGAVMSQIVLADEINRTSPKTQSALLEAMEERQVTVDGVTHALPQPFMVLATQNPVEFAGTYPLPEAQLDRFLLCVTLGYPTVAEEVDILERYTAAEQPPIRQLQPVCAAQDLLRLQGLLTQVYSSPELRQYIAEIAAATRAHPMLSLGVSPRGAIALLKAAQALALLSGRDYVLPDDVRRLMKPVLSHRLQLTPEARMKAVRADDVLDELAAAVSVPVKRRA